MGARKRAGEPGPPPARDSEGEGGAGIGGRDGDGKTPGQGAGPPPAPPPPPPRSSRISVAGASRCPLRKPLPFHAELFQDLSQFQETWLTEGRLLPPALLRFAPLSVVCLLMFVLLLCFVCLAPNTK